MPCKITQNEKCPSCLPSPPPSALSLPPFLPFSLSLSVPFSSTYIQYTKAHKIARYISIKDVRSVEVKNHQRQCNVSLEERHRTIRCAYVMFCLIQTGSEEDQSLGPTKLFWKHEMWLTVTELLLKGFVSASATFSLLYISLFTSIFIPSSFLITHNTLETKNKNSKHCLKEM